MTHLFNVKKNLYYLIRKIIYFISFFSPNYFKIVIYYYCYYFSENKENELFRLNNIIYKKGNAIDVGCNLGLWSYALTKNKKIKKIYSFEPNKEITKNLNDFNSNKIKIFYYALSNKEIIRNLIIPYNKNYELDGYATIEKEIYLKTKSLFKQFKKIIIKSKKLDSFNFKNISFIKIDVEGHELKLLNGSKKFFKLNKPNCLIEIKKKNLPQVQKFFNSLNLNYKCKQKVDTLKLAKENYLFSITK